MHRKLNAEVGDGSLLTKQTVDSELTHKCYHENNNKQQTDFVLTFHLCADWGCHLSQNQALLILHDSLDLLTKFPL